MASGKWMYTPEEASETKEVIESENELDIIMEFVDEAQKNNNETDEEPGEKGDSCDQLS